MFLDLRSPYQQIIQSLGVNDMKSSGYSHGPNSQVEVVVAKGERRTASET